IKADIKSDVPMLMRPDDYLYDRLVHACGKARADGLVDAVKSLIPPTYYSEEHTSFLRAVIGGDTEAYIAKYEWKNNPLGRRFAPSTKREFEVRANGMTVGQAKEQLDGILRKRREERNSARRKLADLSEREAKLVDLISRFVYYRTLTAENSDRYFYYIRKNLLPEIARRVGLNDEKLMLYRWNEVSALRANARLDEGELNKRRNGDVVVFEGGIGKAYYGSNAYALLKKLLPPLPTTDVVCGEIACAGNVTGKVKIVKSPDDAEQMEAGCILVSSMTTPDLTLAMERASGIITDEGGITCHAAIIAREYAVPCLVGTKVATQMLRDGMTVELDCINGFFRIVGGG
ncbi:MAG: hypothetical protein K2M48_07065, partial [Clostridiales bacterium]|nr:hypothetical protein [Clostridiales bacterium]